MPFTSALPLIKTYLGGKCNVRKTIYNEVDKIKGRRVTVLTYLTEFSFIMIMRPKYSG